MADPPPSTLGLPLRVALLNDYEIVVAGLFQMLAPYASRVRVVVEDLGPPGRFAQAVDVALLDTYGLASLERVDHLAADPLVEHVVVFSFVVDRRAADEALARGARGYLSKTTTAPALVDDLHRVAAGELVVRLADPPAGGHAAGSILPWPGTEGRLTERESHILAMLTTGRRNAEIAQALFVSTDTVKTHLRSIYRKLGVTNRAQAVAVALSDPAFGGGSRPGVANHPDRSAPVGPVDG